MLFYYLTIMLLLWAGVTIYLLINTHKISFLRNVKPGTTEPPVAVIIAVRNEEENLEQALKSVCTMRYSNYRIIVVNDRSTDNTAEVLNEVKSIYPQIAVTTITELPKGWLGKNNALYQGYLQAQEEWLLFTDADIVFKAQTLNKAITYCLANDVDHLAMIPDVHSRSGMLNSIMQTFALMFEMKMRPWSARNPKSDAHIGVGAFNLVKREAYRQAGTHQVIKLRPDDDLKLGDILKKAGFKQDVLYGEDEISLEWYPSTREFINGLMKNTFSVSEYNTVSALMSAVATFVVTCIPVPLGLLSGSTTLALLSIGILICHWLLYQFKPGRKKWWYFLTVTYAGGVMAYIIARSTLLTLKNGGIYWRDSFYPLSELKQNKTIS